MMASIPTPQPDYGPIDSPPEPTAPPTELPPMPDDVDVPVPINDPGPDSAVRVSAC